MTRLVLFKIEISVETDKSDRREILEIRDDESVEEFADRVRETMLEMSAVD